MTTYENNVNTKDKYDKITMQNVLDIILEFPRTYTPDDVIVVVETKKGKSKMSVSSDNFKSYVKRILFDTYKQSVSNMVLSNAVDYLKSLRFDNDTDKACYRINSDDDCIRYDLNNNNLEYVEITKNWWNIKNNDNNYFLPGPLATSQVTPKEGNVHILRNYINLSDDNYLLFIVTLIACFKGDILHPVIGIFGEKGSCKSTLSEIFKRILDPAAQNLGELSSKEDDFKLRLTSEYVTVIDNNRKLTNNSQDTVCRNTTGGQLVKRTLFKDIDLTVRKYTSIPVINSINPVIKNTDLIDRSIFFHTPNVSTNRRIPRDKFWESFEKDLPYILGGIFIVLSKALKIYKEIKLDNYIRLADFHRFAYAVATVLGKGERFNHLLIKNKQEYLLNFQEGNSIYKLILAFIDKANGSWNGKSQKLLNELSYLVEDNEEFSELTVPNSVESLGRLISYRSDTFLSSFGIKIDSYRNSDNYACFEIKKILSDDDINTNNGIIKRVPIFRLPIISGEGELSN